MTTIIILGNRVILLYPCINPFRTALSFWGQLTLISRNLSPKRECGSAGVWEKHATTVLKWYTDIILRLLPHLGRSEFLSPPPKSRTPERLFVTNPITNPTDYRTNTTNHTIKINKRGIPQIFGSSSAEYTWDKTSVCHKWLDLNIPSPSAL